MYKGSFYIYFFPHFGQGKLRNNLKDFKPIPVPSFDIFLPIDQYLLIDCSFWQIGEEIYLLSDASRMYG